MLLTGDTDRRDRRGAGAGPGVLERRPPVGRFLLADGWRRRGWGADDLATTRPESRSRTSTLVLWVDESTPATSGMAANLRPDRSQLQNRTDSGTARPSVLVRSHRAPVRFRNLRDRATPPFRNRGRTNNMQKSRVRRVGALLVGLSLVVAACGDDDAESTATEPDVTAAWRHDAGHRSTGRPPKHRPLPKRRRKPPTTAHCRHRSQPAAVASWKECAAARRASMSATGSTASTTSGSPRATPR